MFEKPQQFYAYFRDHDLTLPLLILFVSMLIGISLSQLLFFRLRRIAARISGSYYPLLQRVMTGIPVFLSLILSK